MKRHDIPPEPPANISTAGQFYHFYIEKISLKKGLLSHPKCVSCHSQGTLPEIFPEPRAKITRAEKTAAKAQKETIWEEADNTPTPEVTALAIIPEGPAILKAAEQTEVIAEPESVENTAELATETPEPAKNAEDNKESGTMEINYNVTGPRRKELATAVGDFIGTAPVYQKAPTYAFAIGSYIIDRNGTLSGEKNDELTETLAAQGFTVA